MIDARKTLTLLSCCVYLAVATTSWADFVGVVSEFNIDAATVDLCGEDLGLTVCNVYVQFDEDDDRLLIMAFSDLQVMDGDVAGVFNHHVFGADTPYQCIFLRAFPDLICDSYVAIGENCAGLGGTHVDPDFDGAAFNGAGSIIGGWHVIYQDDGQGDAVNYPDGKVLILQSAVEQGLTLEGPSTLFWQNIGDPTVFEIDVEIVCEAQCPSDCPTDANGDGETGPFDLAALLAAWGSLVVTGNCLDANGDGNIGPIDLAILLAAWGPCP